MFVSYCHVDCGISGMQSPLLSFEAVFVVKLFFFNPDLASRHVMKCCGGIIRSQPSRQSVVRFLTVVVVGVGTLRVPYISTLTFGCFSH